MNNAELYIRYMSRYLPKMEDSMKRDIIVRKLSSVFKQKYYKKYGKYYKFR